MQTRIRPRHRRKKPGSGTQRLSREEELDAIEQFVAENRIRRAPAEPMPEDEAQDPGYRPKWRVNATQMPPEWVQ